MIMEKIKWNEVLDKVHSDKSINFIAEAITPLHVLGIESLILHLESIGIKCKGFILSVAHGKNGLILTDEAFHEACYEGISHYVLDENAETSDKNWHFYQNLKKMTEEGDIFYYATPFRPSFNKIPQIMRLRSSSQLKVFITEEGTASYLTTPYDLTICRSIGWRPHDYIRYAWQTMLRDRLFEKRLIETGRLERFLLLEKKDGKYTRNRACTEQFCKLLASKAVSNDLSIYEDAIVFVPSLLYEDGITTEKCDIEIYKKICEILGEQTYIVKPHPREKNFESYEKLGCMVEKQSRISSEAIFANLKRYPRCIIGDTGTALVNIAALYGIKTIAINKLIDKKYLRQKDYFDGYNKAFGGIIDIPKSEDELMACLEDIKA